MKNLCLLLAAALLTTAESGSARAADDTNAIVTAMELARATYRIDRHAYVTETLQLTEREAAGFWPLYENYRAEMDGLGDELVKLVLEYSDVYPNVPEERAGELLDSYSKMESKLAKERAWYFKRARRVLPAAKVLRWAQLENRLDLGLRLQLASRVPLVPLPAAKP